MRCRFAHAAAQVLSNNYNDMKNLKNEIKEFWTKYPCAKNLISHIEDEEEFFSAHDKIIDRLTPYHFDVFNYEQCAGKKVLEVGCGMGSHAWRFAKFAKEFYAIDLSIKSVQLTRKRFSFHGFGAGGILEADAENLPFRDDSFDLVFSNGVIHHSPNTQRAVDEIYRVLKPTGKTIVMIYNKSSIFYWFDLMFLQRIKYTLLKFLPRKLIKTIFMSRPSIFLLKDYLDCAAWKDLGELALRFSDGYSNPSTKVYTQKQARGIFSKFNGVATGLHSASNRLLEKIKLLEKYFGWGLYIYAKK